MQEVADQDGFEDVKLLLVHCHRKNGSGGSRGGSGGRVRYGRVKEGRVSEIGTLMGDYLECTTCASNGDGGMIPHNLSTNHRHRLTLRRIDLPRHNT